MAEQERAPLMLSVDITKRLASFTLQARFEAPSGITAIFGPSGSGKTSVIKSVAGLLHPDSGRIQLGQRVLFDATHSLPPAQRRIGYVFQDARLFPHMTVQQNLRYGGRADEARIIEMLRLGPLLERRPSSLSGGEAQRVALGRALMSGPELLLMDEPLSALDANLKAEILPYFEELRDDVKVPILYVTHDISEVARLATTLVLMQAGSVLLSGPVTEVLSDPKAVPLLGVQSAGAVIQGTITAFDEADKLTELAFDGGTLTLPGRLGAVGQRFRLRVPAQDVILCRARPEGLSALNILRTTVVSLNKGKGPGVAVGLRCGGTQILARVTARSAQDLQLVEGAEIYAILKATSIAPGDIGTG